MKWSIILCLFLLTLTLVVSDLNAQSQSDYTQEINENVELLAGGMHSPELYANLGYKYYQTGDLANAVLNYEKALKLAPNNDQNRMALSQIKADLPVKVTAIPDFVLWKLYQGTMQLLSSRTWSLLQIGLSVVLLAFIYKWLFLNPLKGKLLNWSLLITLSLFILMTSFFTYHKLQDEIGGTTGVSMDYQDVFEGADERSAVVVSIGPGNKVYILDKIGEWYKVQLEDKDIGWIKSTQISLI